MRHIVDLSHTITHRMTTYPGLPGPEISDHLTRAESERAYGPGTTFHIARISMVANTGTYLDTPAHRFADGADLDAMPLTALADLAGVRIVASEGRKIGPDVFGDRDLRDKAVLIATGWSQHWAEPQYGTNAPYLSGDGAEYLVAAGVALVGIDSVNIDDMDDPTRPAHTQVLAAQVPIVEHLTNVMKLPDEGFRFFAVPPRVRSVGTFPVRAFAIVAE